MQDRQQIVEYLKSKFSYTHLIEFESKFDAILIKTTKEHILSAIKVLKKDSKLQFTTLIDIFGADFPERENRFEINYNFLSLKYNLRCIIKIECEADSVIPSIYEIFEGAIWFEREIYDMYGILFGNNPDLRRILTDYGFQGHPLRKDFPLTGYVEVRYDFETQKVVYEPVKLMQEFRNFDFLSPWEGTEYKIPGTLPGDEKAKN
ncbi:NADH-quinone oxidoreductase subunit C [Rickettsiales endosymbiont of Stachyamoeba lipophora]|uniref:NADH-quinone oxidoreductase subunit C n=1 Tax=Rickettsiales endosymbiont of Stachyamoeba lipophora TaxID=2486578 RepID=UPI000F64FF71|nr:NADH-quinone oxidoreductase subunit C [Rickettsiales endosymbiont of Stachyamoeba lipophora]AZL16008.1 NADH-quinone oxidoreductase subunit C [Rickettsiales endosymbiont of Stachyamoeba lipophora]